MTQGPWTPLDNATWLASAIFGYFWVVTIGFETLFRYKRTSLWNMVLVALVANSLKYAVTIVYLNTANAAQAAIIFNYYAVINTIVFGGSHYALYRRKTGITPEKPFISDIPLLGSISLDEIVLFICLSTDIAQAVITIAVPNASWSITCNVLVTGSVLNFLYNDVFYCFKFARMCLKNNGSVTGSEAAQVFIPVAWTVLCSLGYLIPTELYAYGMASFASNAIWNFVSVIEPLVNVQSAISTASRDLLNTTVNKSRSGKSTKNNSRFV